MTEGTANPLIAGRQDSTEWYSGVGIAESITDTVQGVESGSWVDSTIGGVSASLDALGLMVDPLGSLVSWGVAWLIEHVKPLSDALDWLAGDPDQIAAYAQTWRNVAAQTTDMAGEFRNALARQTGDWGGPAAEAYHGHAGEQLAAMDALTRAAAGIGGIVEGAGLLVALVREMVRDLIADFVSVLAVRLPVWLAEEGATFGLATPLVVSQVGSLVAKWAAKISKLVLGLLNSLRRLKPMLKHLGDAIDKLHELLRRLARRDATETGGSDGSGSRGDSPETPTDKDGTGGDPDLGDNGRTEPSGVADPAATPRGTPTDASPIRNQDRGLRRENESATTLAQHGYDVEQNPPGRENGKNPDYRIEGRYFDNYAPTAQNAGRIRDGISSKVKSGQADQIVLNLDDTAVTPQDLKEVLTRRPVNDLKEIIIVKDGTPTTFFPFD